MSTGGTFLYPNVTSVPAGAPGQSARSRELPKTGPGEFDRVLDESVSRALEEKLRAPDLSQAKQPLKFSAHASQRLADRKIDLNGDLMARVSDAVDKAAAKGIEDTLVLTENAALIVSVKNRTVITAMDRGSLNGNVFTNIDGAVIV